jgi:hypothetical protein
MSTHHIVARYIPIPFDVGRHGVASKTRDIVAR